MSIKRTVECDVCPKVYTEKKPGDGFPGWGQFNGIRLDDTDNPYFCPSCLKDIADFVDNYKEDKK